MRVVSVERGRDPRTHVMIAFGGAGPLHATRLARALGVPRVMIPYGAGVGSALGLLTADQKIDNSITRVLPLDASSIKSVEAVFSELEARLNEELKLVKKTSGEVYWRRGCSMRYRGQGYELRVDLPDGPIDENFVSAAQKAFEAAYEANYGYVDKNAQIEGIDWHLMAVIPSGQRAFIRARAEQAASGEYTPTWRRAYFPEAGGFVETPVISRYGMRVGQKVSGPVLIEERESTTIVLPGDVAHITESGHLMVDINAEKVA